MIRQELDQNSMAGSTQINKILAEIIYFSRSGAV